jgi:hypothetical protein
MAGIYFIGATLTGIGFLYVVSVLIRASGLAKFSVYFEFHNDNNHRKQLKK